MSREKIDALEALYAELPKLDCKGLCTNSCGLVPMTGLEFERLMKRRRVDGLTFGRADEKVYMVGDPETLVCPLLRKGRCTVYDVRPLICRLWGMVEGMPCTHGCKPERLLTNEEGHALIRRVMEIAT